MTILPFRSQEGLRCYRFDRFVLDPAKRTLEADDDATVVLTQRAFDLLMLFVESEGRLFSRDEIMRAVWGDVSVDENNLHQQIAALRRLLGTGAIQTVPRQGYRFTPTVIQLAEEPPDVEKIAPRGSRIPRAMLLGAMAMLVLATGLIAYSRAGSAPPIRVGAIAVLPLKSVHGNDPSGLTLGITDALIARLGSSLHTIDVRPFSAVRAYTASSTDAATAGRQLQVDAVLDGTVDESAGAVLIRLRLVDASTGRQLWTDVYRDAREDRFAVQERIAEAVAHTLSVTLSPSPVARAASPSSREAAALYFASRHYFFLRGEENLATSERLLRRAVALDPQFAVAWSALADVLAMTNRPDEARAAATTALRIDSTLSDAHASLGDLYLFHDRDWPRAEAAFKNALRLNPSNASAHQSYAFFLAVHGRFGEAVREIRRAQELDPQSPSVSTSVGSILYYAHRIDEAIAQHQRTIARHPEYLQAKIELGLAYAAAGENAKAAPLLEGSDQGLAAYAAALRGDAAGARKRLAMLDAANAAAQMWRGITLTRLGDRDEAIAALDRAANGNVADVILYGVDPLYDRIRDDARFQQICKRMRL